MMVEQAGPPSRIELRLRDLHVRAWLAALHETASHLVYGDIHDGRLCLCPVPSREPLIVLDWACSLVTIRVSGHPEMSRFSNIQSALVFLGGAMEHHIAQVHQTIASPPTGPAIPSDQLRGSR